MDIGRIVEIHLDMCINEKVTQKLKERLSDTQVHRLNDYYSELSPIWFWNYDGRTYAVRSSFNDDRSPIRAVFPLGHAFWRRLRKAIRRVVK